LSGSTSDEFRIPGTPSQQAIDLLQERFPQASADGATARMVFATPAGQRLTAAAPRAAVERAVAELRRAPQVASVNDPLQAGTVNPAGTVGFAQATFRVPAQDLTDADRDALTGIADRARANGLSVEVGGDALQAPAERGGPCSSSSATGTNSPTATTRRRPPGGRSARPAQRSCSPVSPS
jgi:RND superfamily putative drug exporter